MNLLAGLVWLLRVPSRAAAARPVREKVLRVGAQLAAVGVVGLPVAVLTGSVWLYVTAMVAAYVVVSYGWDIIQLREGGDSP